MNEQMMKERIQQALNAQMSGVRTSPAERSRLYENAIGGTKVKRKLTVGLVFAIVLVLMTAAAVATILLTQREIVEQVAVPLAVDNDSDLGVREHYSTEELAELVRNLNENGITLEENSMIMRALQTGKGYYEEEAIMDICREAFGGTMYTWTLEEQDWFSRMMVDIGFSESYESFLPGKDNMTYEQAEAYALDKLKKVYGEDLHPEDRTAYALGRAFYRDPEGSGEAIWYFELMPKDLEHGQYTISFMDRDPEGTAEIDLRIRNWSEPYSGGKLLAACNQVYGWSQGKWPQAVWQKLHEMMLTAEIDPEDDSCREYRGYQLTEYPEPAAGEIARNEAIRIAGEAVKDKKAAMESAVLTEYEGKRAWLVSLFHSTDEDDIMGFTGDRFVVTVDSITGKVESIRQETEDDDNSLAYVPEAAYSKAGEGLVPKSERIRTATDAVVKAYPELDLLNEAEYELRAYVGKDGVELSFNTKNTHHGDVYATISRDGTVGEVTADTTELTGDNVLDRYESMYGWYGNWDQQTWAQLAKDMEPLDPESFEGQLLKMGRYPEENTVRIGHEEAMKLAIKASGKRTAEINTCILIGAEPHPVWKLRVMAYDDNDWADKMIELDAETGEVLAVEPFKTEYTQEYVLYALEKNRRALELKMFGPAVIARREVTYAFGDLSLDCPEPEFDDPEQYEIREDGLTVRFIGQEDFTESYEVELDENGYVIRCEKTSPQASAEKTE